MNNKYTLAIALILISLPILLGLRNLNVSLGTLYYRDQVLPLDLNYSITSWDERLSGQNLEINKIPLYVLFRMLSIFFDSDMIVTSIIYIILFLIVLIPFSYTIKKLEIIPLTFNKKIIVAAISSSLLLLNPWTLERFSNHLIMVFGFAISSVAFAQYYVWLTKKINKNTELIALLFTYLIVGVVTSHGVLYVIPISGFITLLALLIHKDIKRILLKSVMFFSIWLLCSSYWILPNAYKAFNGGGISPSYAFDISEIQRLSQESDAIDIFRFSSGSGWSTNANDLEFVNTLPILIWVPILLAYAFLPRKKVTLLFAILWLFLFTMAMGTKSPINVFEILMTSPLKGIIWVYRDPARFVPYLLITTAFAIVYLFVELEKVNKKTFFYLLPIFLGIMLTPAVYHFILFPEKYLVNSKPPNDLLQTQIFLKNMNPGMTMWLPMRDYYYYNWLPEKVLAGDLYRISSLAPNYGITTSSGLKAETLRAAYSQLLLRNRIHEYINFLRYIGINKVVIHKDLAGWQRQEADNIERLFLKCSFCEKQIESDNYAIFTIANNLNRNDKIKIYETSSFFQDQPIYTYDYNVDLLKTSQTNFDVIKNSDATIEVKTKPQSINHNYIRFTVNINNLIDYNDLHLSITPGKQNSGTEYYLKIYENEKSFQFNRYNLITDAKNEIVFPLTNILKNEATNKQFNKIDKIEFGIIRKSDGKKYYDENSINSFSIHSIKIRTNRGKAISIDAILKSIKQIENNAIEPKELIKYSESVHKYQGEVNISTSSIITLAEGYDPGWIAIFRSKNTGEYFKVKSTLSMGVQNSFLITKNGLYEYTIEYIPERWFRLGILISSITLLLIMLFSFIRINKNI